MRSERDLVVLHREMRKTAFERLSPALVKTIEEKVATVVEENRARTRDAR